MLYQYSILIKHPTTRTMTMTYIIKTAHTHEQYDNEFEFIHRMYNLQFHKIAYTFEVKDRFNNKNLSIEPKEKLFSN